MSEASYLTELRTAAPHAPERLHQLVRSLPSAQPRFALRLRPAISAAIVLVLTVGVGAAIFDGLRQDPGGRANYRNYFGAPAGSTTEKARQPRALKASIPAPALTADARLQSQDVAMSLRVENLSEATQSAVRTTRRLGGFVAGADYSTDTGAGNSRLRLRVPVVNLQTAIARFTALGTILSQHISVADLQTGLDQLNARIANARKAGHKKQVTRLERRRAALVREGTYAKVALQLTTTKPAAKQVVPSRFDRFRDNAGDILGKELIAVLYFLVIAGPSILLAALVLLGERARRRRADHRLLEETG